MPLAVQGASSSTASNGLPSHQRAISAASHTPTSALSARRERFSLMRGARCGSDSRAVTEQSASSSRCAVLPPGAAQASRMRSPERGARNRPANCAPASCTLTSPSAKPGIRFTGRAFSSKTACPPSARAGQPAACASASHFSTVVLRTLTRSVIGGFLCSVSKRVSRFSAPNSLRMRSIHQPGALKRATRSERMALSSDDFSRR